MRADEQDKQAGQRQTRTRERPRGAWAFDLVTVAGIPVRIHVSFLLLLGWVAFAAGTARWSAVVYVLLLFGCVVLHELGHSLMALRFGVGVSEIVLYPIGGVARLQRIPGPKEELWISLAGPAVNIALAVMLLAPMVALQLAGPWQEASLVSGSWMQKMVVANLGLFVFNMIPAFPMDGGRVLRALLALRMGDVRATQVAAAVGQGLAVLLAIVGLFVNPFLLLIAFVVFTGAGQEATMVRGKALVAGISVREAAVTDFRSLPVGATLAEATQVLLSTSQREFPVVHGDEVVGVLDRNALVQALAAQGEFAYVAGAMQREYLAVDPNAQLEEAAAAMQDNEAAFALVMESGRLVGMLTAENVSELLVVRQALQQRGARV